MNGPRITIFLGAGGVGKTTLAAGHALALAESGARVGLLGIDPSRRLKGALGVAIGETPRSIPGHESCFASILTPAESLRRWAAGHADESARAALLANPFFIALADRLATATDLIAAVRIAEWLALDPSLDHLVVDTAPGLDAIELLRRPRLLATFLEGDLVRWLRRLARASTGVRGPSGLLVAALARVGGARLLRDLASFLAGIEEPASRMLVRVAEARRLVEEDARILLVTTIRDDAAEAASAIARALGDTGLAPSATIVNRAVPPSFGSELAGIDPLSLSRSDGVLVRYASAYADTQARVVAAMAPLAPRCISIPVTCGLDRTNRIDALKALGRALLV